MMATYFNGGSEIQADNLQTLYLMNRGGYAAAYSSDASQQPPGVLFLNNGAGGNSASAHAHQGSIHHHQQHHLVGIPLAGAASSQDDTGRPSLHEISAVGSSAAALHGQLVPRFHYNLWGGGGGGDPSASGGHQIPTAIAMSGGGGELGSPMGFRRPAPVTIAATSSTSSLDHHHHLHHNQQGGLSLSLNNSSPHNKNAAARPMAVLSPGSATPTSVSGVSHGGAPSMIAGSKFLKAAQQLLDEVVNVGKAIDSKTDGINTKDKAKAAVVETGDRSSGGGESGGAKGAAELTTAQRQELQMKKAKLLNMLDEVEQRYRQYHSQMQMVAASFEQAAGEGSAKSYTALALQTISKQFRCLKDAIASQIKETGKSMGEEEDDDDEGGEGKARSRLRMVDHQLRQQRALQQLGMMHHNAWRPQRGLPERAVSVLRAWLFEHFLHPYPKDSDKHMLAKQTGLTRSQVSNWFINARVRLWKPMVEEMYVEEMKSQEQQNGSDNNIAITKTTTNANDHNNDAASPKSLHSRHGHNHSFNQNPQELLAPNDVVSNPAMSTMISPSSSNGPLQGFSLSEMDPMMGHRSPKRQRMMINSDVVPTTTILTSMDKLEMKPGGRDLFPPDLTGFGSYPMGEIGSRFNPDHQHHYSHQGNTVSLTLGLPHDCDQSLTLSATHHQQSYFPGHGGAQAVQMPSAGGGYEEMNDVQSRKRFAAQLLPDYVT